MSVKSWSQYQDEKPPLAPFVLSDVLEELLTIEPGEFRRTERMLEIVGEDHFYLLHPDGVGYDNEEDNDCVSTAGFFALIAASGGTPIRHAILPAASPTDYSPPGVTWWLVVQQGEGAFCLPLWVDNAVEYALVGLDCFLALTPAELTTWLDRAVMAYRGHLERRLGDMGLHCSEAW